MGQKVNFARFRWTRGLSIAHAVEKKKKLRDVH